MILIDMEMPQNCNVCPFHDWEYYVCLTPGNGNQDEDVMDYNTARHPKCPLIDIKNPYGVSKCTIGNDSNTSKN